MDLVTVLLIVNFILLVGLISLYMYEARRLEEYNATMELFIASNSEIFGVVNTNADVSRELAERLLVTEKNGEFFKVLLDAHAHVLRIYGPALEKFDDPVSNKIQNL